MAAALQQGMVLLAIDSMYHMVSTRVGQHAVTFIDRILCIIESLNFYAAPISQQQEARQELKEMQDYKRPLPWFLFVPMLLFFRVLRTVISGVAVLFGMKAVSPIIVVYYMQSLRRSLRYIKIQGSRMMTNPEGRPTTLPFLLRVAINLFTWGPLQFFTIVGRLVFGDKTYNVYSTTPSQLRSKRSQKKLKTVDNNECNTADLLDKYADEDDNDPMNDPDFEVKASDLVSETEEEEENSEPEEDLGVQENGANEGEAKGEEKEKPEANKQENNEHENTQPEENHHDNNHHHQDEHHHY